jgi:hypothetical protein
MRYAKKGMKKRNRKRYAKKLDMKKRNRKRYAEK